MSRMLRDRIARICQERSWKFLPRSVETFKAPSGRPVSLIPAEFAGALYGKIHRTRAAVLVLGSDPRVPLHPKQEDALKFKRHIQLKRYIDYKCFYCKVSADPENDGWTGMFARWCRVSHCEGEQDPRCLPFHVFRGDGKGLDVLENRQQFNELYGTAKRCDDTKSIWNLLPRDYHGNETLHVAGHELSKGFHWDVKIDGSRDFNTAQFAWRVTGHVNVYPDAFLRRGSGKVRDLLR